MRVTRAYPPEAYLPYYHGMDLKTIRANLARANLSQLARITKIDVRTLRRIKSGETADSRLSTLIAIERGIAKMREAR